MKPNIKPHIDGLVIIQSDGSIRWLTLWERLLYLCKIKDADSLDRGWDVNRKKPS